MEPIHAKSEDAELSGKYTNGQISFYFKGKECLGYGPDNTLMSRSPYHVRGNYVYISPPESDLKSMTRKAFVVYIIEGNNLVASHIEDMETGDKFYQEMAGTIILRKE